VIYAVWISFQYLSIDLASYVELADYVTARAVEIPTYPGYVALSEIEERNFGAYYLDDARYFLGKYFGLPVSGGIPLDRVVSSSIFGVAPDDGTFVVPVTVGAIPELSVNFGMVAACLGMGLWGGLFAQLSLNSQAATRQPFWRAAQIFLLFQMHTYLLNGGLIYLLINIGATLFFLAVLHAILRDVCRRNDGDDIGSGARRGRAVS